MELNGEGLIQLERIIKAGSVDPPKTEEINGIPYVRGGVAAVPPPVAAALHINTLSGFVTYAKERAARDMPNADAILTAHVVGPEQVRLERALHPTTRQRETLAIATFASLLGQATPFAYGKYMTLESLVVALLALFEDSAARATLLAVVGNVKDTRVVQAEDDGVSQTVTARAGIATVENVHVPNPIVLVPFRTFREVLQPASPFVVRVKQQDGGELPTVALFEGDGGQWQLTAIQFIAEYLRKHLPKEVVVIA